MARAWTPQQDLSGVCAVMDVRQGRSPASGATESWAAAFSAQYGDRSGTQPTVANRPTFSASAFGSNIPGFTTDGTDFFGGLAVGATSQHRTVVALASFGATSNRTIVGGIDNGDFGYRRDNSRRIQIIASNVAALATDTVAVPDNTPTILAVRFTQATTADFRQNGRGTTNVVPTGNALKASNTMQIGAALGTQQLIGALGCIIIANAYVSDADILRCEGWLAHANGVAHLLVDGHPYKAAAPTVEDAQASSRADASATAQDATAAGAGRARASSTATATVHAAALGTGQARSAAIATSSTLATATARGVPSARGQGAAAASPVQAAATAWTTAQAQGAGRARDDVASATAHSHARAVAASSAPSTELLTHGASHVDARAVAALDDSALYAFGRARVDVSTPIDGRHLVTPVARDHFVTVAADAPLVMPPAERNIVP